MMKQSLRTSLAEKKQLLRKVTNAIKVVLNPKNKLESGKEKQVLIPVPVRSFIKLPALTLLLVTLAQFSYAQPSRVEGTWMADGTGTYNNNLGTLTARRGNTLTFRGQANATIGTNVQRRVLFNNSTGNYSPKWVTNSATDFTKETRVTNGAIINSSTDINFRINQGNYYTMVIGNNSGSSNDLAILESSFNPTTFGIAPSNSTPVANSNVTITVRLSTNPASGENVFVRYSNDNFVSNFNVVQVSGFSGGVGTATIPAAFNIGNTTVSYYPFTTTASAPAAANADYLALRVQTQSGENGSIWSYSVPASVPGAPTVGTVTPGNTSLFVNWTAPSSNGGSAITNYKYSIDGTNYVSLGTATPANPFTISGLTNGTTYPVTLRAVNSIGDGTVSNSVNGTPRTVPGAPTIGTATAGNAQATVSFTAPASDGGASISSYTVTSSPGGITGTGASSPITVTGLTNGTAYTFTVTATNAAGTGSASSASNSVTPAATPRFLNSTYTNQSGTGGNAQYNATAYPFEGLAFNSYKIVVSNNSTGDQYFRFMNTSGAETFPPADGTIFTTNSATPVTFSGSTGAFRINIASSNDRLIFKSTSAATTVACFVLSNQGSTTIPSISSQTTPSGSGMAGQVTTINATLTSAFVTGQAAYVRYTINSTDFTTNGVVKKMTRSGSNLSVTIPAASNNDVIRYYLFTSGDFDGSSGLTGTTTMLNANADLYTINANGSSASPYSYTVTATTPTAPTITSIDAGNAQLTVNINIPSSDGGSAITNYKYSLNGGAFTAFSPAQTGPSTLTITGLTNGTSYSVQVLAVNAIGDGAASNSVSQTPNIVPDAPTINTITSGNTQLTVNFTAPAPNGGSAISNYKYSTDGGSTYTAVSPASTSSPIIITGLTNGTAYNVKIRAVNAGGDGAQSNQVTATPYTTPSAPTINTITGSTNTLTVNFTAGSTGGSAITNYKYSLDGGSFISAGTTTSPITITGLNNGQTYGVTILAVNAAGDGAVSNSVNGTPQAVSSATDYFRSKAVTANWNDGTPGNVWESSPNGSTGWINATLTPGSTATAVTISAGSTITVPSGYSLTLGGTLTIASTGTLTIANQITTNGAVTVNGTFRVSGSLTGGSSNAAVLGSGAWDYDEAAATLIFSSTGTYNFNDGNFWPVGSTTRPFNVQVLSGGLQLNSVAQRVIDGTFTVGGTTNIFANSSSYLVNGTLQINSGGLFTNPVVVYGANSTLKYNTGTSITSNFSGTWVVSDLTGSTAPGTARPANVQISNNTSVTLTNNAFFWVKGNLTIDNGSSLTIPTSNALRVSGNLQLDGSLDLGGASSATGADIYVGGNWTRSSTGSITNRGRAVFLNGTNTQTITANGGAVFAFLFIAKTAGTGGVTLASNVSVSNNLDLGSSNSARGIITTGSNSITVFGSVIGAGTSTGWINGTLTRSIGTGAQTPTFDIGDATNYTPASLNFSNVTVSGLITATNTTGLHPQISSAGLDNTKYVNRYWTLSSSSGTFGSFSGTFTFVSGDLVGSPNTANLVFGRYASSTWTYPTIGTRTSTSAAASGFAGLGDFVIAIGKTPSNSFTVSGGSSSCAGTGTTIGLSGSETFASYQLKNGASNVGSPVAGTGSAISFGTQTAAGTYTVVASHGQDATLTATMTGSATVNSLPTAFNVTGTGSYCSGGTGVAVGLDGSQSGVNYQLKNGATNIGSPVAGTGSAISFGLQTTAATYTVVATNATTGCQNTMTGSAVVTINSLPTASITGVTSVCSGDSTILKASGGTLFNWDGAGFSSTATIKVTTAGSYSVLVRDANGCTSASAASATVTFNACQDYTSTAANAGFANGDNDNVCGFGNWALSTTGQSFESGNFKATISNSRCDVLTSNSSWAQFSNAGQTAAAVRPFISPMSNGNSLRFRFDNGDIQSGGTVGFGIQNASNQNLVEIYFKGGFTNYYVNDAGGEQQTSVPFTNGGLRVKFTLTSSTTYVITLSRSSNAYSEVITGTLKTPSSGTQVPAQVRFFSFNAGTEAPSPSTGLYDSYFNDLKLSLSSNPFTAALSRNGSGAVCNGSSINLKVDITDPAGLVASGYTVVYNDGSGNTTVNNYTSGTNIAATVSGTKNYSLVSVTRNTGSCTATVSGTYSITGTTAPNAGTLSGTTSICSNGSTTFTSNGDAGTWSSGSPLVATIDASSGVISPVSAGSSIMTYTVTGTGGCSNATATRTVNVTAAPNAGTLSGTQSICLTGTTTFTSNGDAGTWSSDNTGVASIDASSGVISPASTGSATMTYTVTGTGGCSNATAQRSVTVNANTAISSDASPLSQTVYIGTTPDNLTVSATGSGTLTYQWKLSPGGTNATGTGNNTNTYTPPTSGSVSSQSYYCTVTGDCGSVNSRVVTVNFTDQNVWKGGGTNQWSLGSNWQLNIAPTSTTNAAVPVGNTPYPVLSANAAVQNIQIDPGATVNINGNTLTINGTVTGTGTLSGSSSSSLVMGAASSGTVYFTSGANTLKNLTINGGTTTLGNALNIAAGVAGPSQQAGVVTLASGATLVSNGNLTLKSNIYGTARIDQLPVNGSGVALATITGNVTIERYISDNSGNRAWRLLSVPTKGSQTFKQAWQEGQAAMANGVPGYGTILTSTYGSWAANGYDAQTTAGNLLLYNNSTSAYSEVSSTNSAMQTTGGYYVYIRGDRSVNPSSSITSATATTLRTTGTLYTGDQTAINVGAQRYAVVGNIYPSSVDFTQLEKSPGLQNSFYIWDPKVMTGISQTGTQLGGYNAFSATNNWEPTAPTGSYPTNQANTLIESGQAFFVYNPSTTTTNTIRFKESAKVAGNAYNVLRPNSTSGRVKTNLLAVAGATSTSIDGTSVVFNSLYSNAVDVDDTRKISNSGENFCILRDGQYLVIEGRQPIQDKDTIFYYMWNMQQKDYKLQIIPLNGINAAGLTAYLEDSYLSSSTLVSLADTSYYSFTVNSNAASSASTRFRLIFIQSNTVPLGFVSVNAYQQRNAIKVDWKVGAENGMSNYVIERSTDGRNFSSIGTVAATGNNGQTIGYSFLDQSPLNSVNYYRIRSIRNSGEVKYSQVVKVVPGNLQPSISLLSNPVKGNSIGMQLNNLEAGDYVSRITNITGQVVFTGNFNHTGGSSVQTINLPIMLTSGTYQVEVIAKDKSIRFTESMIKE